MSLYLDYNASAPIEERVLKVMIDVYRNVIGNSDSRTHDYGDNARKVVENGRHQVASLLHVEPTEVFFTSGATESNNIAIQGLRDYAKASGKKHIITSSIEHKAILETVKYMEKEGFSVDIVDPDISGRVDAEKVLSLVKDNTLLVSIMHVNNETGIIQPVYEIGEKLSSKDVLFHVDATQSCGKLVEELRKTKYTSLSFSAHKLQGPQGVGALILKKKGFKRSPVKNIMFGGQQEHGIRPGTVPVALVAGCGKACEIAEKEYQVNNKRTEELKLILIQTLKESGIEFHFNGDQAYCVSNTANICFSGVMSEALMISTKHLCSVSNGSACTSKSYTPSYVLSAMGIPVEEIENSIRVSWGASIDKVSFQQNLEEMINIAKSLIF